MSYCRFSTDAFRCDVYAYADDKGWAIHVAGRKRDVPADWREPLNDLLDPSRDAKESLAEYHRFYEQMDRLPWIPLDVPSAGKTFHELSLPAFRARMLALRAEGLRFPDSVLEEIEEEEAEEADHAQKR